MEDVNVMAMEELEMEETKKFNLVKAVKDNWKTITAVVVSSTVAGIVGYKFGLSKGLTLEQVSDVAETVFDEVDVTNL